MRLPLAAALCTGLVLAAPMPARALESPLALTYELPNPWRSAAYAVPAYDGAVGRALTGGMAMSPTAAALSTAGPTLLMNGIAVSSLFMPDPTYGIHWALGSMAIAPLTLWPGYQFVGEPGRGALVVLGGYVAEVVGAAATGFALKSTQSPGEGSAYAFVAGLVIGPLVSNTLYALWAASDVYRIAEARGQ